MADLAVASLNFAGHSLRLDLMNIFMKCLNFLRWRKTTPKNERKNARKKTSGETEEKLGGGRRYKRDPKHVFLEEGVERQRSLERETEGGQAPIWSVAP